MASAPNGQGYNLLLADGQSWHHEASDSAREWLSEYARILELKEGPQAGQKNVYFVRGQFPDLLENIFNNNTALLGDLPRDGWNYYKSGIQVWYHDQCPDIIINLGTGFVPRPDDDTTEDQHEVMQMSFSLFPYYKHCVESGGTPFHSGIVSRDGKVVLLAAPGGTGKSTCCRRIASPWKPLGDDEALIVATGPGTYEVQPFPTWSDYVYHRNRLTWNTSYHQPLHAIFFLEQAPADKAIPLNSGIAAGFIFKSSMQAFARSLVGMDIGSVKMFRNKVFDNACVIARHVPAYKLQVSMTGQFWEEMEGIMPRIKP